MHNLILEEAKMNGKRVPEGPDRREVLVRILPAGAFACLLCPHALAGMAGQVDGAGPAPENGYKDRSEMSYEEVFQFAYLNGLIPWMKALGAEVGREKLVAMLARASSSAAVEQMRERLKKNPKNDLTTYTSDVRNPDPLFRHAVSFKLVEDTPAAVEAHINGCLWAKTFREADAADIGYACLCQTEFAAVPAFNPKIKLTMSKTLMQGHDCCNPRYVLET